ncbi:MAG: hypothetical protein K5855_09705 [Oscillospiraceae bacterium]|jgi:hypothetical protein|nr:hypothetical protein [Oscillospiraceae bacterium]
MKKPLLSAMCFLLGALLGAVLCLLSVTLKMSHENKNAVPTVPAVPVSADGEKAEEVVEAAYSVTAAIRDGDYETLSAFVHPEYGLIVSPYSTVNLASNQCLTPVRVASIAKDDTEYIWGTRPDTGEPIRMTAAEYFSGFAYDCDFMSAPLLGVNRIVKSGNALENVASVFPEGEFVDFCVPGTDEEGLEWRILRLVFEPYEDSLRLTAVIHSQYTN